VKNSIGINKILWNEKYNWKKDGDEWDGQALKWKVDYEYWKQSLIQNLITSNIRKNDTVLEIGAGRGRWSVFLAKSAETLILVDLSLNCIEFC